MIENLIPFYVMMILVWIMTVFRNLIFKGAYALVGKSITHVKSSKVDIGLSVMFFSIIAGVTIFALVPSMSTDVGTMLIIVPGCVGAFIVALGVGDEWRSNKKAR